MVRKFYTFEVDDEKLLKEKNAVAEKSKTVKIDMSKSQKEVESFGIVEINNAGASKKIKNNKDAGYEKNLNNSAKKTVKSEVSYVDDYFDFCFRPTEKHEVVVEVQEVEKTKVCAVKKTAKTTAKSASKTTKVATKTAKTTKISAKSKVVANKVDFETKVQEENNLSYAEACDRQELDDQANKIVWVARMGALFDCDATMMN